MKFTVDLDDETARRLDALAESSGEPRNALVRRAVTDLLERRRRVWPEAILQYRGDARIPPFESFRDKLKPPSADPLARKRQ